MKKVAVILSGCGKLDGSEIHESVLVLLALSQREVAYQCMAPNRLQVKVVDHITQETSSETRHMMVESARIARGAIIDVATARAEDYAGAIYPGGFGAALHLSDFAVRGKEAAGDPDVLHFARAMKHQKKPQGFICIAPTLVPLIYGAGVRVTVGNDVEVAAALGAMGAVHVNARADEVVVDDTHRVLSTPAYMLGKSIAEVHAGIDALVARFVTML